MSESILSASPESVSRSITPPKVYDGFVTPSRSRSASPVKTVPNGEKSRSLTPDGKVSPDYNRFDRFHNFNYKSLSSLDKKSSTVGDYHGTFNSHKCSTLDRNIDKTGPLTGSKSPGDVLVRLGVPSLQPFNKTEKSYRPINFNPVINKLAQTVN